MAEKSKVGEGTSASNADGEFLPGFKNVNAYSSRALRALLLATKASNNLPNAGDDYDYYSSFEAFRDIMDLEGKKLLEVAQNVIRYHGVKGNIVKKREESELEEMFDALVDVNDQLLERVGSFLDEAVGLNKQEPQLVVASVPPKQISGSWNKSSTKGVMGNYRLLSAKNIQRPQLKFKEKIDNTTRPFVPRIKYKHNALKPLPESLVIAQQDDTVQTIHTADSDEILFPHPYQYELDHLTHPAFMLEKSEPQEALPVAQTPLKIVEDVPQLKKLCELLKKQKEIAVDLEHHSYRTYQGITCLMQISTRSQDFVIDTLSLWSDLHVLNEVFTDPQIVKVFHGADLDIEWLQRDFGLYVVNMFDTGQAARVLNVGRYSLAHLLLTYCSVVADKQFQLADWRIRPLPDVLINYAREDTHYLLYIYDKLRNQLLDLGNKQKNLLMSTLTRSTQVCARKYEKPNIENRYLTLYMRSKKVLNTQQMYALKELDRWRDSLGRQEDESTGYVLPNHMMLQIADILPKEGPGILACCNPVPPLVRQNLGTLAHIIREAREVPLSKPITPRNTPKPSMNQHPKYNTANPFNCPHDLSYQELRQKDQQFTVTPPEASLVAEKSSMLNASKKARVSPITSKVAPQLTVFAWSPQVAPPVTATQKKAAEVRASFISPFEKYLPSQGVQVVRTTATMKITSSPAASTELPTWKLKPNTPKVKPETVTAAVVTISQPIMKPEEVAEGVVPFSQMVPKKKRKKGKDTDAAIIEAINLAESMDQEANEPLGKQEKIQDVKVSKKEDKQKPFTSTSVVNKEVKKRKKEKLTVEQLEADGFEGHDYSKSDFRIFTEPSGKKSKKDKNKPQRKEFDPESTPLESDYKTGAKPRLTGGTKSQTFGRQTKQEGTSWPKR